MRPIWSGLISFGLVNIPVVLYPATEDSDIAFHFLHAKDEGSIKNQRVCTKCGEVVAYKDLVRGYEYEKGRYVVIDDEDLKKGAVESSRNISIEEFVDPAEIDPIYYDKPYYIAPDKKSEKAYTLLRQAMLDSGKAGIAKVALRSREHLAAVRPGEHGLMLYMMHFTDEIRSAEGVSIPNVSVGDKELKMAEMLIETMVEKFDPAKYRDTYAGSIHEVIDAKLAGRSPEERAQEQSATDVVDLMTRLKASLEEAEKKTGKSQEDEKGDAGKQRRAA